MSVWRIILKPDVKENIDATEFCRERHILGVGWPVEDGSKVLEWEDYCRLGSTLYIDGYGDKGWWPALNAIRNRMQNNDLCWTRDSNGIYYLGRIRGDWKYQWENEYKTADLVNIRACKWVDVGSVDAVPGKVLNSFRTRRTVQQVHDNTAENYSKVLYSKLSGTGFYSKPEIEIKNLFSLISPEDCEDLVGIYLQSKFSYTLIPSTCRRDTIKTEFILKNDKGEKAYVQVKQGDVCLNRDDFIELTPPSSHDKWFLFSTNNIYDGKLADHIICLEPSEIERFAIEHRNRMSGRVQYFMEFLGI